LQARLRGADATQVAYVPGIDHGQRDSEYDAADNYFVEFKCTAPEQQVYLDGMRVAENQQE